MKWFEADTIWDSLYKITTKEDFVEKFVVETKFHSKVPKDIVEAFETVSYLLANSYYHYNLLDVALSKMLLIIEMTVKLKAKELKIPLKLPPNKKEKILDKRLFDLINEVCTKANLEFLISDFDRARNLRNGFMHPEEHTIHGVFGATTKNYILFNNIINQFFLTPNEVSLLVSKRLTIKEDFEKFKEIFKSKLFILNDSNQKVLINDIHYHKYFSFNQNELLFLLVNPLLLDVYDRITNRKFGAPYLLILKEFDFINSKITGVGIDNNQIEIYETENPLDLEQLRIYSNEMNLVSENDKQLFNLHRKSEALWEIEKVVYNNLWEC